LAENWAGSVFLAGNSMKTALTILTEREFAFGETIAPPKFSSFRKENSFLLLCQQTKAALILRFQDRV